MDDLKIDIDSKAARKLIDTVASGVGAVAGHWFTRGRTRAEADSIRITAQAKKDAEDIALGTKRLDRTGKLIEVLKPQSSALEELNEDVGVEARLSYQEHKRQNNLIDIVHQAQEKLPDEVSEEEVDPDWISKFFTYAQDISNEDMQLIWAKILSDEVVKPGRTSIRTLEYLKNMTQDEAKLFEKLKPYIIIDSILSTVCTPREKYGISFEDLMRLEQAGLIFSKWPLQKTFSCAVPESKKFITVIPLGKSKQAIIQHDNPNANLKYQVITLTYMAKEVLSATGVVDLDEKYIEEFQKGASGFDFKIIDILTTKN